MKIITDLEKLQTVAEPLEFITEKGIEKEEGNEIIGKLKAFLEKDKGLTAVTITAPQLGINKRIFCMNFADGIKTFINPVITKKAKYVIQPETFASMPGKEILISRPEEITMVYYTDEYKYEENKLVGVAARLFDQSCQLLDGVTPDILGVVSDIEEDGSLWDLTEEEMKQLKDMYGQIIAARGKSLIDKVKEDPELEKKYNEFLFAEKVINGDAAVVGKSPDSKKGQAVAALSLKRSRQAGHLQNRANRVHFINQKRK